MISADLLERDLSFVNSQSKNCIAERIYSIVDKK